MQDTMLYRTALNRIVEMRREALTSAGKTEQRVRNQARSWSSVAFWQTKRDLRA